MTTLLLGAMVILLATFLAGAVGFAYGLIALPLLLLIGVPLPEVVVINLIVGLATRLMVVFRLHREMNKSRAALLVMGSLPGVGVGIALTGLLNSNVIELAAGVFTLIAVTLLIIRPTRDTADKSAVVTVLAAGGLGGFLGVTTSLNGIPPALLLTSSRAAASTLVADLAAYFVVGNTLTLLALGVSGHLPPTTIWPMLVVWIPIGFVGNVLGVSLGRSLPHAAFRRLTLTIIVISGVVSTLRALF